MTVIESGYFPTDRELFTRLEWLDARTYDICVNPSSIGLDNAVTIIKNSLKYRLDSYANCAGKKEEQTSFCLIDLENPFWNFVHLNSAGISPTHQSVETPCLV